MQSIFPNAPKKFISPLLKWVGGKRALAPTLRKLMPPLSQINNYVEPFVGAGGMLLSVQPKKAVINDLNGELINVYRVVRDTPKELLLELEKHVNSVEHFYKIRDIDRSPLFAKLSVIEKAARIIYLNKTCFNGLYRVNSQGFFNVPYGYYKNPDYREYSKVCAISEYLNRNDIMILNGNYCDTLSHIEKGTLVYLDPPYAPVSQTSNFTGYNAGGFSYEEQIRLKKFCDIIAEKEAFFMLSNSDCSFVRELYHEYRIHEIQAPRAVAASPNSRGAITELVVTNFDCHGYPMSSVSHREKMA